jgi:hypothetical protein
MLADGVAVDLTPDIMQIAGTRRSLSNVGVRAGVRDIYACAKSLEKAR